VSLNKYEIGLKMAQKIYQVYEEETLRVMEEDPYQFVFDIEGFGFRRADDIARRNGLSMTHSNRIGAGCIFVLQKSVQNGHVYLPLNDVLYQAMELLDTQGLTEEMIVAAIKELHTEKTLIIQDEQIYLP